ncbi:MAG: outer membrane lipoprotein carrier protein LolA [Bacteroidales bacterium]|nr:outer membrane lipoprotein carrier protein LolA [Bacteroidales bacterium]
MKRKVFVFLLAGLLASWQLAAQGVEVSGAERGQLMARVSQKAAAVNAISCKFTQVKQSPMLANEAVSKGRMQYTKPDKLVWQYTAPVSYTFAVAGDSVSTSSPSRSPMRMMKGMSQLIVGSVSGSALFDERMFATAIYKEKSGYRCEMTPRRRDMQRLFGKITMTVDAQTLMVTTVVLHESDGATTTIVFSDMEVR